MLFDHTHLYHAVPAETLGESLPVPKTQKRSEDSKTDKDGKIWLQRKSWVEIP